MVGTVEATLSDPSSFSMNTDGENLKSDVLYPSICDAEQMPDRTQMSFAYRTFFESSGEKNAIQAREAQIPHSLEDTEANTQIMSGSTHNFSEDGHMDNFEGKAEPLFPKWRLPSKIRRKFTTTNKDHDCFMQEASKTVQNANDIGDHAAVHSPKNNLRVCVDCNTTKTPLWRGGPQGPKSLCNACGIRYRKKRRALFASLNPDNAQSVPPKKRINLLHTGKKQYKSSKSSSMGAGSHLPLQVNKFLAFYHRHGFEKDMYGNRSSSIPNKTSHSAFERRFEQEEEEAAKLLMAISYGLVYA